MVHLDMSAPADTSVGVSSGQESKEYCGKHAIIDTSDECCCHIRQQISGKLDPHGWLDGQDHIGKKLARTEE